MQSSIRPALLQKRTWRGLGTIGLGVAGLTAGVWYGYNKYLK